MADPTAGSAGQAPVFDVHEWGALILSPIAQARGGTGPRVRPSGSAPPQMTAVPAKPVLYFHSDHPQTFGVNVRVRMPPGMAVVETFPNVRLGPEVQWLVKVHQGACDLAPIPTIGSAGCGGTPDGLCERAELGLYRTTDATCLVSSNNGYNHLFYRGAGTRAPPAVESTPTPQGRRITNGLSETLRAVYVSDARTQPPTIRRVQGLAPGAAGDASELVDASTLSTELRAGLSAGGLTQSEANTFMVAWEQALLDGPQPGGETVFYFLPESMLDGVATLEFSPSPRHVRRVMLVIHELPPR